MKACQIFNFLDVDGDGEISEEEFMQGCLQNEDLVLVLSSEAMGQDILGGQSMEENPVSGRMGDTDTTEDVEKEI